MNKIPAKQMSKPTTMPTTMSTSKLKTTSIRTHSKMTKQDTNKTKQQLIAKEVFSPQATKYRREK